jgi:hypothetical protein
MSRGLGKRQRSILEVLRVHRTFWLRSMLARKCTKAEYNALLRAALKLEEAGLIRIDRYAWGATPGIGKTAVRRTDAVQPLRRSVVSVGEVHPGYVANT